ncbi:hypothetical protein ACIQUQ_18915 [Streptomyces sp. NPDC101118]|uniref:hypothetical protein n=1 Tax=Streptomyces sp. NPDC101118 TaxID=3366109 RepID=UPI00380A85FB
MTPGRCSRAVRAAMFAAVCVLLASVGHVTMSGLPVPGWAMAAAFACAAAAAWALAGRERGLLAVTAATVAVQTALHAVFSLVQALAHPALPHGASLVRQWARYAACGDPSLSALFPQDAPRAAAGPAGHPSPGSTAPTAPADTAVHAHHGMHGMLGTHGTDAHHGMLGTHGTDAHHGMLGTHGTDAVHGMQGMHGIPGMHGMDTVQGMAGAPADALGAVLPAGSHGMPGMSPSGMLAAHLLAAVLAGLWLAHGEQAAFRLLRVLAAWFCTPLRLLFVPAPVPHRPPARTRRERRHSPLRQLLLVHAITSRGPPRGTAVA